MQPGRLRRVPPAQAPKTARHMPVIPTRYIRRLDQLSL